MEPMTTTCLSKGTCESRAASAESDYDYIVIGSGFGGSVSALRLAEKGYRVLVLEKGKRWKKAEFPSSNWRLHRWLWKPCIGLAGFFQMTFLRHVTAFSGVGVGGGSLVYANTLPIPRAEFFRSGSWAQLADWGEELAPYYAKAKEMLGATENPTLDVGDKVLQELAVEMGREDRFERTNVAVFFGEPEIEVADPFFGGSGPKRTGCTRCGGCMIGCRVGAKNTLDLNYLYLAEKLGAKVLPRMTALAVRAQAGGYVVEARYRLLGRRQQFTARGVVVAAGVLGSTDLLLRMKSDVRGLPKLSDRLGFDVRTNSESLIAVTTRRRDLDLSEGIAIGSILHTDDVSHLEPVRYPAGSGFFRGLVTVHAPGTTVFKRLQAMAARFLRKPLRYLAAMCVRDWARSTQILLFMRVAPGTLRLKLGRSVRNLFRKRLVSVVAEGEAPRADIPEATALADRFANKIDGVPTSLLTETLLGVPSTAHILGGACMGAEASQGVIDKDQRVFGYENLFVVDGSAISANPGVNPALTITALAERAMSKIVAKENLQ